jgi:hypothetical protein
MCKITGAVVPVHAVKSYGGGGTAPLTLNLGTRQRLMFNPTPLPLYPLGDAGTPLIHGRIAPDPVSTQWGRDKYLAPAGNRTTIPRLSMP